MEIPLSHNWLEPPMLIFDDMRNRVSPRPRALPVSKLANSDPLDNLTPRTVTTLCLQEANGDAQETAAMAQAVDSPIVATATEMRKPTPASSRCSRRGLLSPRPRYRAPHPAWRP